ncbi:hypothetical protein V5096_01980 [Pseudoalteromonas carrageenovora]|uniref:hypothetical protein n=1 Tax=Pseudoalteromonas carrageenovora TaxID=227 RepID=UPI002FD5B871
MIVGNGQIAKAFESHAELSQFVIFASGVANSKCAEQSEFEREKSLLLKHLTTLNGRKIVYFSSCALSADNYPLTPYYQHKKNMESLIKNHTDDFYIFRVPQLFGPLKKHPTLINYLYFAIKEKCTFTIYDGAYRYIIELSDLVSIVMNYISTQPSGICLDVANNYLYSVLEIVQELEKLLSVQANYNITQLNDSYTIDLSLISQFISKSGLDISFGKSYLLRNLTKITKY